MQGLSPSTTYYWQFIASAEHYAQEATGQFTTTAESNPPIIRAFTFAPGTTSGWEGEISAIGVPATAEIEQVVFSIESGWTFSGSSLRFGGRSVAVDGAAPLPLAEFNGLSPVGQWLLDGTATKTQPSSEKNPIISLTTTSMA